MSKRLIKSINIVNETFLFVLLVSIFATSFYIAKSIQISPKDPAVLGLSIPNEANKFLKSEINSNINNIYTIEENIYEINFDISLKNIGKEPVLSILGELFNDDINPKNYRISLVANESYINDFNAYLIAGEDQYDLLINGEYFNNNLLLAQNKSALIKLKIVPTKEILSKFDLNLKIYK